MSPGRKLVVILVLSAAAVGMTLATGRLYPQGLRRSLGAVMARGPEVGREYGFAVLRRLSPAPGDEDSGRRLTLGDRRAAAVFVFPRTPPPASYFSLVCRYQGGGRFLVLRYWTHPWRRLKWVVSVVAMLLVFFWLGRDLLRGRLRLGV